MLPTGMCNINADLLTDLGRLYSKPKFQSVNR
jgi:hypothetical protein